MWLVIVGIILAIIFLIVLSPIKIYVSASDTFLVKIRLLFLNLYTFDSSVEKKTEKDIKEKDNIKSTICKITNQNDNYNKIVILIKMLKSILSKFAKLLKHIEVEKFNFNITVAGNDAADTAIKYGNVCSIVYPLSTLLSKCVNFKPENISVYSNFNDNNTNFNLSFLISVRVIYLISFAVSSVFDIIKLRIGVKK